MDEVAKAFVESYKTVLLTLFFVVPGFVFFFIYSLFGWKQAKSESNSVLLLKYFTVSCINLGFWIVRLYNVALQSPKPGENLNISQISQLLLVMLFISPACAAVVLGSLNLLVFKTKLKPLLNRLGWFKIEPIPTGWDWKFYQQEEGVFILVSLIDGSAVAGYFGDKSLASDSPEERDLFIQQVFEIRKKGPWRMRERTDGILIKADQIKHVEFFAAS